MNKITRNLFTVVLSLYISSLNPFSEVDMRKRDEIVVSTNGFYYTRRGSDGYLYAIEVNGKHKRDICLGRFPHRYPQCMKNLLTIKR